jgi:hypothetical protein
MLSVALAGFGCAKAVPALSPAVSPTDSPDVATAAPKSMPAPPELRSALAPKLTDESDEREKVQADDRAAMARQVAALERSIALYREFIARAGGDPMYAEAVKRSQERIEDASKILDFLRQRPIE